MEYQKEIISLITDSFKEDMPDGDITTQSTVSKETIAKGFVVAKGDYIVSGLDIAKLAYSIMDNEIIFSSEFKNGETILKGKKLFEVKGNAASILKAERVVLNIIGIMMGVATKTKSYCDLIKGTNTILLDTRKTIPCMRALQKRAVIDGGGQNHRFSLSDAVLIKENHIIACGSITKALQLVSHLKNIKIEIEVQNLEELNEALKSNPDIILLDNMPVEMIKQAVEINKGRVKLEASGGIDSKTIRAYAEAGVDYISLGTLTHSIDNPDLSFLLEYL